MKFKMTDESGNIINEKIEMMFSKYFIRGGAIIRTWVNSISVIMMKSFDIDAEDIKNEEDFENKIRPLLNDNGFGCAEILGAYVQIYAVYENEKFGCECKRFVNDKYVMLNDHVDEEAMEVAFNMVNDMY